MKKKPEALLPPDIFGCDPAVVQVDAATTQQLVLALKIQHAELETLTLYKNLADEYGLSIFKDLKDLTTEVENLRAKLKTYEDLGGAADDMQLLRMGYAAARLEIESLRGQQNKDTP